MKYKLTVAEQYIFDELSRQRNEVVVPINAKINRVTEEMCERLQITPEDILGIEVSEGVVEVKDVPAQEVLVGEVVENDGDI